MTVLSPFCQQGSGPRYLFISKQFEQHLAELSEFLSHRQGIAVISGDDGVGKTTLVQTLLQRLPPLLQPLIIIRPEAEPLAITLMMAQSMGITIRHSNLVNLTSLAEAIQGAAQQEKYFLLIVDDAHVLTDQNLEEIYVISQMEHEGRQLLPIILTGRNGLLHKLSTEENQRLHNLIGCNLTVTGLTFEETIQYIDHRLQQVGSSFEECFTEGCPDPLFSRTGGIPRRINQVCDQALNQAWQEHRVQVTPDMIGWEEPLSEGTLPLLSKFGSLTKFGTLAAAVLIFLSLVGYAAYSHYYPVPPPTTSSQVADKAASLTEALHEHSPFLNTPEWQKVKKILSQLREAQLKKDINLFVRAYSPAFPGLEEKKGRILKNWKRYKYLYLDFTIENIYQQDANSIIAKVVWDTSVEDLRSKEKRYVVKKFIVHFSNASGEWLIQKLFEDKKTGLAVQG